MSHAEWYVNDHESQYQAGASARTRSQGCTWTAGANGADASTGGRVDPEPDKVLSLVPRTQETNPDTPGWSLDDLDRAMARLGVGFEVRSGSGWAAVERALDDDLYVVLQGDSAVFSNATCSGAFDGDHCIGVHPQRDALLRQRINDGICPGARYAGRGILRSYAQKFSPTVRFGVFTTPVPRIDQPHVVLNAPAPAERNAMITYANGVTATHRMTLAKGQPLFRHPGGPKVTGMSKQQAVGHVGLAGKGWRAVKVGTGVPYRDGRVRPTVLYVPANAGEID